MDNIEFSEKSNWDIENRDSVIRKISEDDMSQLFYSNQKKMMPDTHFESVKGSRGNLFTSF